MYKSNILFIWNAKRELIWSGYDFYSPFYSIEPNVEDQGVEIMVKLAWCEKMFLRRAAHPTETATLLKNWEQLKLKKKGFILACALGSPFLKNKTVRVSNRLVSIIVSYNSYMPVRDSVRYQTRSVKAKNLNYFSDFTL